MAYVALYVGVREGDPRPIGTVDDIVLMGERDDVNLLFILIDTLRAHRIGSYGYDRDTSPTIDYLAETGVRFSRHLAQSSWTKASMASLWTSIEPPRTGVTRFDHALPEAVVMPAEILKAAGFRTAGIWRNGWVAPNFGFSQGFEVYATPRPGRIPASVRQNNPHISLEGTDRDVSRSAHEFLRAYGNQRWFLYLHLMDVHQYLYDEASALFGFDRGDLYDNSIRHTDDILAELLNNLMERGLIENTLVVITADHGEAFGERGMEGHAAGVYRETTEIPWILSFPFILDPGVTVEMRSRNVDIWPTLLEMLGLPSLPHSDGRSLLPEIVATATGEDFEEDLRPAYAHLDRTWGTAGQATKSRVAVVVGSRRFIQAIDPDEAPREELFDAGRDPLETEDILPAEPETSEHLRKLAEAYLQAGEPPWGETQSVEVDEMQLNQLRALGYQLP